MSRPRLNIVVLTCSGLGYETAAAVSELDVVERTSVVRAEPRRPSTFRKRLKKAYRGHGPLGTLALILRKVTRMSRSSDEVLPEETEWASFEVGRFEDDEGLALLRSLSPDIVIVDGTYILPASVFSLPTLGTINIHCGYLPDFKGAPPAFWEIYEGETSVGVTIHFVTEDLDGGDIIERRQFPLDPAPEGDPVEYAERVWRDVLRPAGWDMLRRAIRKAAQGTLDSIPQKSAEGRMFRSPSYREVRELRRRVRERRSR